MRVDVVLAPNPGPYTGSGTNSYVISSEGEAVVLDPGPIIASHMTSIERTLATSRPLAVLVTHTHPDHAPAANVLAERLDVPTLGYAPGPEFEPTHTLDDGDLVEVGEVTLTAVHTPGHTADHLCYRIGDMLFTGDHIMGGSTVLIEDATAYMRSLHIVEAIAPRHLYPGHGPEIPDASTAITEYIEHRLERERQVVDALHSGAETADDVVAIVYSGLDSILTPAAAAQVLVQLRKLESDGVVVLRADESGATRASLL